MKRVFILCFIIALAALSMGQTAIRGNYQPIGVGFGDSGDVDAFSRLRVGNPTTLFDSQSQYNAGPLFWEDKTASGGTATHVADESAVDLDVTTTLGSKVTRQTREYFRYQPGKSQLVVVTGNFGAAVAGVTQQMGYFDDENGIFLQRDDDGAIEIVRRSNVTGSVVDTEVAQASWNVDPLNGTGAENHITLDFTKAQIFFVDLEWLGVGRVRCGFVIDGKNYVAHQFNHANSVTTTYMTTANLPVRYEIETTDTAATGATLKAICCTVISEGGFSDERGLPQSAGLSAGVSVSTRRPVLSIRPAATFNSITNRAKVQIESIGIMAETKAAYIEIVYNGTLGVTPSWASVGSSSTVEKDTASTTVTGGTTLWSGYVAASNVSKAASEFFGGPTGKLPLTLDIAGANPIGLSVVATGVGGTSTVYASINWKEIY